MRSTNEHFQEQSIPMILNSNNDLHCHWEDFVVKLSFSPDIF